MLRVVCLFLLFTPLSVDARDTITIGGTGSGLEMMRLLGGLYAKQQHGVTVSVVPSLGSSGGIKALQEGVLNIAISARPVKSTEKGVVGTLLCRTPLAFAVHPTSAVSTIRTEDLVTLYGDLGHRWADGSRSRVVLRPEAEIDTQVLRRISPAVDHAVSLAKAHTGMIVAVTDQDNLKMLQATPGGIGMVSLAMVAAERARVKVLAYNGVKASLRNIEQGRYPLTREYYLITRVSDSRDVQGFVSFVRSATGLSFLKKLQCAPEVLR